MAVYLCAGALDVDLFINSLVDILQGKEKEFLRSLQELEGDASLSVSKLEIQIDKIKCCVAEVIYLFLLDLLISHFRNKSVRSMLLFKLLFFKTG